MIHRFWSQHSQVCTTGSSSTTSPLRESKEQNWQRAYPKKQHLNTGQPKNLNSNTQRYEKETTPSVQRNRQQRTARES
jgi:hypothetical protein